MRGKVFIGVAAAAMAVVTIGLLRGSPAHRPYVHLRSQAERAWEQPIPELRTSGGPLEKVIAQLHAITGADFVVDWRGLQSIGFDRDTQMERVNLHGMALADAMKYVLSPTHDPVAAANESIGASLRADGVIFISKASSSGAFLRVYDVRDLVGNDRWTPSSSPILSSYQTARISRQDEIMENLITTIEYSIDAENWRENGGSYGCMQAFDGRLLIMQTCETHRRIQQLLDELRSPGSTPLAAPSSVRAAARNR